MLALPEEADVLARLAAWGRADPAIRALVLTSSRARADESVDDLSDYDLIVAVDDPVAFLANDTWVDGYGRPLVRWGDERELYGSTATFCGVVYADGVKVDYTIWPAASLEHVAQAEKLPEDLDVGYQVLLDKDGRTAAWPAATYRAHIPEKPAATEYRALVEEFWWDTTYVAKALWRGEVVFAKFVLDYDAKHVALRRMLEWRIEQDHHWSLRPGAYGRGLERHLPDELRSELAATYVGTDIEDNWNALLRTTALFRRIATEVGHALGYAYPLDVDKAVTSHLEAVRLMSGWAPSTAGGPRDAGR